MIQIGQRALLQTCALLQVLAGGQQAIGVELVGPEAGIQIEHFTLLQRQGALDRVVAQLRLTVAQCHAARVDADVLAPALMQQHFIAVCWRQFGSFALQDQWLLGKTVDALAVGRPIIRSRLAGGQRLAGLAEDNYLDLIQTVGPGQRGEQAEQQGGEKTVVTHGAILD